jgi:hypothetical protein
VRFRDTVVRVGTIACFAGGAAVGALVAPPQKFVTTLGAEWIARAVAAAAAFSALLFLLNVIDHGVIQALSPRAFSTRSIDWPDPRTPEDDLRQEVREITRLVGKLSDEVERLERRLEIVERRRWRRR